ncbi:accessory gene regulator B family protein [Paenibacillus sp. BR2-3]|uniref:accessory gene regulator B family protein n=1 Tax=Paenibacillus sp. BR2-3 TaxID=3048494 RepID=UPI0039773C40
MNPEQTCSIEIMQYSLNIILNTILAFIGSALIGILLNNLPETMLFIVSFSILRLCSGGFHLKTSSACNIATILLCSLTPYFFSITGNTGWIINAISLVIMILFAPNPDKNAQIPRTLYPRLKLFSILLVGLNFWFGSAVIGLAYIAQSLTVIPWNRRL